MKKIYTAPQAKIINVLNCSAMLATSGGLKTDSSEPAIIEDGKVEMEGKWRGNRFYE